MAWTYVQSSGDVCRNGVFVARGYSGAGRGLDNPALQAVASVGPVPRGKWRMVSIGDSPTTGKSTIILAPAPDTDTCGRSAFRIHGDNARLDHSASHGCIILPLAVRLSIWRSGDRDLVVVA